jgi:plasmid stabilization system protein ParE
MAFEIRWTPEATETFGAIIFWLEQHWTEREIAAFIRKTEHTIKHISDYPEMYKASSKRAIRVANITSQINLFYKTNKTRDTIILLSFWDNRQNPEKQKY